MTIDLSGFEPRVRALDPEWAALAYEVTIKPISPNYGKPVTLAEFVGTDWLASVIVWETGELDLDAGRVADGWLVSKHYDLERVDQLDEVFGELAALFRDGDVPPDAMTSWLNVG